MTRPTMTYRPPTRGSTRTCAVMVPRTIGRPARSSDQPPGQSRAAQQTAGSTVPEPPPDSRAPDSEGSDGEASDGEGSDGEASDSEGSDGEASDSEVSGT